MGTRIVPLRFFRKGEKSPWLDSRGIR